MDACFEILLSSKQPIDNLECYQKTISWDGVEYPQVPKYYLWGTYIRLVERPMTQHIRNYLPPSFTENEWTCLAVEGEGFDLLELEVNGSEIDWEGKTLDSLLKLLLTPQTQWVIVFEWHCDQIDKVYSLYMDECMVKIKDNLKYEKPREGFIILSVT